MQTTRRAATGMGRRCSKAERPAPKQLKSSTELTNLSEPVSHFQWKQAWRNLRQLGGTCSTGAKPSALRA